MPIFSPLIGLNKTEITKLARKIGTYKTSIKPYPDCCSFMIAKHPETKAILSKVLEKEQNIKDADNLINQTLGKTEVLRISPNKV